MLDRELDEEHHRVCTWPGTPCDLTDWARILKVTVKTPGSLEEFNCICVRCWLWDARAVSLSGLLSEQPGKLSVTSLAVSNTADRLVPG